MEKYGLMLCLFMLTPFKMWGAGCTAPTEATKDRVAAYVHARYQVPNGTDLLLKDSAQANKDCFWKMSYVVPGRTIIIYLSPDGGYITPLLYDLSVDPAAEQRDKAVAVAKELTAGEVAKRGSTKAPVTIVEFSDFQCPFCKGMTETLETEVLPKESDKVALVFRNFPLTMHPWAKAAAEMAECARMQSPEAFWTLHDVFFTQQGGLRVETVRPVADAVLRKSDVNLAQFDLCVAREQALGAVEQDLELGKKMGVRGTPTLFVNGMLYTGARDAAALERMIEGISSGKPLSDFQVQAAPETRAGGAGASGILPGLNNQCAPAPRTQAAKGADHEIVLR